MATVDGEGDTDHWSSPELPAAPLHPTVDLLALTGCPGRVPATHRFLGRGRWPRRLLWPAVSRGVWGKLLTSFWEIHRPCFAASPRGPSLPALQPCVPARLFLHLKEAPSGPRRRLLPGSAPVRKVEAQGPSSSWLGARQQGWAGGDPCPGLVCGGCVRIRAYLCFCLCPLDLCHLSCFRVFCKIKLTCLNTNVRGVIFKTHFPETLRQTVVHVFPEGYRASRDSHTDAAQPDLLVCMFQKTFLFMNYYQ